MNHFNKKAFINQQSFSIDKFEEDHSNEPSSIQTECRVLTSRSPIPDLHVGVTSVTNDEFLSAIFGDSFTSAYPLVCKKIGDPDISGWVAKK